MPTINYYFADLYPDQYGEPDLSVVISDAEWNRRIEQEHHWESNGRMARREVSLFDMIHAEILGEHNAEKAKVRNRRKADRKHKLTPKMRKEQEYMRNWNVCMKMVDYGTWDDIPIVEGRVRSAEKIARADFDAEIRQHEDALAEYDDYVYWADEHDRRYRTIRRYLLDLPLRGDLNHLRNMTEELTREMRYEECRIKDMCENARIIWEGECY